jgi:hypothetical protein
VRLCQPQFIKKTLIKRSYLADQLKLAPIINNQSGKSPDDLSLRDKTVAQKTSTVPYSASPEFKLQFHIFITCAIVVLYY